MRLLSLAAAALLACASFTSAAETAPVAPAANIAFGKNALKVVTPAVTTAQTGVDTAKAANGLGLGGDKAKKKIDKAQGQLDTAKALQADMTLVADGKPPAKDGLIASLTAGNPNQPGTMDKLKGLPGVETVTSVLATPGVPEALLSLSPIDQVPGVPAGLLK